VPLLATVVLNFALGALAALAAAGELRASPRPLHRLRAFRALAVHEVLVAMPVAGYLLVRLADWMVSYLVDGARLPSALVAALVLVHGTAGLGGFATGARLLRDHRARAVAALAAGSAALVLVAWLMARDRIGVLGSYVQFRGGFGLQPLWRTGAFGVILALAATWTAAGAHLLWSLARRAA
jgi:hypothetical protein